MDPAAESSDPVVVLVASSDSEPENSNREIPCISSPHILRGRKRRQPGPLNQDNLGAVENTLVSSILEINSNLAKMVHVQAEIANTFKSFANKMDHFLTCMESNSKGQTQVNGLDSPVNGESGIKRKAASTASTNGIGAEPASVNEPKTNTVEEGRQPESKPAEKTPLRKLGERHPRKGSSSKPEPTLSARTTRASEVQEKRTTRRRSAERKQ